jgi:hypothetical protein
MPVVNDAYLYLCDSACPASQVFDQVAHRQAIWGIPTAGGYGSAGDLRRVNNQQPTISADWRDEPEYGDIARLVDFFVNHVSSWWRVSDCLVRTVDVTPTLLGLADAGEVSGLDGRSGHPYP